MKVIIIHDNKERANFVGMLNYAIKYANGQIKQFDYVYYIERNMLETNIRYTYDHEIKALSKLINM